MHRRFGNKRSPAGRGRRNPACGCYRAANADGDTVTLSGDGFVLFGRAEPFGEPVFAHGPFVMNTREEIVQAIADYNAGSLALCPGRGRASFDTHPSDAAQDDLSSIVMVSSAKRVSNHATHRGEQPGRVANVAST